jgi:hypothetical protein
MITNFINSIIYNREFLFSLVILIIGAYFFYYFGLKKFSPKDISKFWLSTVLMLLFNLVVSAVLVFTIFYFTKSQAFGFVNLFLLFNLFYSANLLIGFFLVKKNTVVKGKRSGDVLDPVKEELSENKFRTLNLFLILALVLFPMLVLGNGNINLLIIFLLISGVVSSISEIFLLPKTLKQLEKVFK